MRSGLRGAMKNLFQSGATWTRGTILEIVANVDPEVLQWPGGSVFAMLLAVYATIAIVLEGQAKWLGYGARPGSVGKGMALSSASYRHVAIG